MLKLKLTLSKRRQAAQKAKIDAGERIQLAKITAGVQIAKIHADAEERIQLAKINAGIEEERIQLAKINAEERIQLAKTKANEEGEVSFTNPGRSIYLSFVILPAVKVYVRCHTVH
jgi:hypothetical protein